MTDTNGTPPPTPQLPTDVGIAVLYLDLAQHMLVGMVNQLKACAGGSKVLPQVGAVFTSMSQHLLNQRTEVLRQAASGVVIAQPGDVPPRRLQ